jgi:predicted RNase H-like HicB family nuclease/predicted RNA binding protein YcfA (HicA-like mRNA interferase family)
MKISEILTMLKDDGWYLVAAKGRHRQFKPPFKPDRVTIPGSPAMTSRREQRAASSNKQAGSDIMRYAIVIEKAANNFSAYVPDLPGCIATGASIEEVEAEIKEAIAFHPEGMREDGITPPIPQSQVDYAEVAA